MMNIKHKDPFSSDYSFYKMCWVFLIFSFLGDLMEGFYMVLLFGHFESRSGLIYGPICEIYGFGAIIVILLLYRFRDKSIWFLFLSAFTISVVFEFSSSVFQEAVFGYRSWDYGNAVYAIAGRANMIYATVWGFFSVILVRNVYPKLNIVLNKFSSKIGLFVTWLLIIFLIFDFTVSSLAVYRYNERQKNIPAMNIIQIEMDKYYPDAYLEKIFARIKTGRN